jgi:site-specific DNA-methyltransferase (adenine-specific)
MILFAQTPFDKVLGASNLGDLRYEIIWQKSNATGHLNAKRMPLKGHENILVFYRKQPTYNPQKTLGHQRKVAVKRKDITEIYGSQTFTTLPYDSTERYPTSVITFSSDKQRSNLHPTQKPVALLSWLIQTYSNPGDTVIDNCMGSGSTGEACVLTSRKFIGIEQDKFYFDTAKTRIDSILRA